MADARSSENGFDPNLMSDHIFLEISAQTFLNAGLNSFVVGHDDGVVLTFAPPIGNVVSAPGPTGLSGVKLFDVTRVDGARDVGHRLDHPDLEQDLAGFLQEPLQLAGEELLVRGLVLPAQVL